MEGRPTLYLYRDPSYRHSYRVVAPFKHLKGRFAHKSWKQETNERLSSVRIAVEHALGIHESFRPTQLIGKVYKLGRR
jgi:hypothetical protein